MEATREAHDTENKTKLRLVLLSRIQFEVEIDAVGWSEVVVVGG